MTNDKAEQSEGDIDLPEVIFVCASFAVGGTEKHLLSVTASLVERGWHVSVYALCGVGGLRAEFEATGATIIFPRCSHEEGPRSLPYRIREVIGGAILLYSSMRRLRPAIVHFFLPKAYLVGAPVAMLAQIPIKMMSRRSLNYYRVAHPILWRLEKLLHRSMTAILGNSRRVIAQLRNEEGVPANRLGLIYNGIDTHAFLQRTEVSDLRAKLGLAPAMLALIVVANLIAYKGHTDLLRALALTQARLPSDWRLFIVGRDDGIGAELRAQAVAAGLEENVVFLGERKDVPALLSVCDIGLSCSHEEGFSNAVLEGMAAGLAMIVTDVGGNPEAVGDCEAGLIVPARDPQQLAEAIVRLSNDAVLRAQLGAAGRRRVAEHFTLEQCAERYDILYRGLLQGRLPKDLPEIAVASG